MLARLAFAVVTATLLLIEITLTRVFSGTIGYYFAFMSISVAMLGLGAGSLWVTLRGKVGMDPDERAGWAALALAITTAWATLLYLRHYPEIGAPGAVDGTTQWAQTRIFAALFTPFLMGGVLVSVVFEARRKEFSAWYAIDLLGAAIGCVVAPILLHRVAAPKALFWIALVGGFAAPMFMLSAKKRAQAAFATVVLLAVFGYGAKRQVEPELFDLPVIRNHRVQGIAKDRWNDFSRVIVKWGMFCTWGLSETYPDRKMDTQFDLLIEGVAGTQIQQMPDRDVKKLDYMGYDVSAMPHYLRTKGSTLVLGVGGGLDILMARFFDKAPVVGVEVNPLVGDIVNNDFSSWSGRPYELPEVTIHFENARTWVKRDPNRYDVVTVTWVDSGAATGAGAFALTENYLYTVEAFVDYLARVKDDGVLSFMRARHDPEYDAIKGVGVAVEALRRIGVTDPTKHIMATSIASPFFHGRMLTQVLLKRQPFTAEEIATVEGIRAKFHFTDAYTPGKTGGDPDITRLVEGKDREAVYASFPFDMVPNTDDRPFYFFLREGPHWKPTNDVKILRMSVITIFSLIGAFLVVPMAALLWRVKRRRLVVAPTIYFAALGLGFMLIEMKLLQQAGLVVGNPTLTLSVVIGSLLLSTGLGALYSPRITGDRAKWVFGALLAILLFALLFSARLANMLTSMPLFFRATGLVLAIAPLGFLLGCPLPLGMRAIGDEEAAPGLVPWCWGINGMLGVAGTGVATYIAIYHGLSAAFMCGVACYLVAALVYLRVLAPRT